MLNYCLNELKKRVGAYFKKHGFRKVGEKWLFRGNDCDLIFILDRSRNSESFYLRVCFWFPEIEALPEKLSHSGSYHMSVELADIVPKAEELELQFNFSDLIAYPATDDERIQVVESISDEIIACLVRDWSSVNLVKENTLRDCLKKQE